MSDDEHIAEQQEYDVYDLAQKQEEYDAFGIRKEEIRSYEVSLWTLQDTFITVLKWSDVEQVGRIQDPKMTLSTDGTQNFEFSIPMYIYQDGELIENPNWYTIHDGNLLAATRKVKVIFNKGTSDEAVFEFIILDVNEVHDNDILTCEVKCEGLAFHELGKIGYNYSLSQDTFYLDYKEWAEGDNRGSTPEPIQNIDYWCKKINLKPLPDSNINPRQWYYKVDMAYANTNSANKIYEESFVSSWKVENGELVADKVENAREKARPISAEQSNIYNITQQLAETFQVFCRYEYGYDENYHIISRTVVFYNSFLMEQDGISSITYPYNSAHISRNKDATNLTTKLYVLNLDDESAFDGVRSIMNVDANKTRENYILNFDYMKEIGNVDQEQYDAIKAYEKKWRDLNIELARLQGNLAAYQQQKPELEGKLASCRKSIEVAEEQMNQNRQLQQELSLDSGGDGKWIIVEPKNPDIRFVIKQGKKYIVKLDNTNKGIDGGSLKVYVDFNNAPSANETNLKESDNFATFGTIKQITDDAGNLISLQLKPGKRDGKKYEFEDAAKVYLTYRYDPKLYYEKIISMWSMRVDIDRTNQVKYENQLYGRSLNDEDPETISPVEPGILATIKTLEKQIENKLLDKQASILEFEQMMGPALREGYWQPDGYTDYGDQKVNQIYFNTKTALKDKNGMDVSNKNEAKIALNDNLIKDTNLSCIPVWDSELFEDEQELFYYDSYSTQGSASEKAYHYYVDLSNITIPDNANLSEWNFVFTDPLDVDVTSPVAATVETLVAFGFGSKALIRYMVHLDAGSGTYKIIPVLLLIGASELGKTSLAHMQSVDCSPRIGNIHVGLDSQTDTPAIIGSGTVVSVKQATENDFLVYPRIKCSSLNLKTDTSSFFLTREGYTVDGTDTSYPPVVINRFEDYYYNTKMVQRSNNYYVEQFFTLKPEVLFQLHTTQAHPITVNYIISNADTSIYLDALEVSKENAFPKVSYEITPSAIDHSVMRKLYKQLARVIMINDVELKLEDVFGYISSIDLDLDRPWEDTITVQNYTNKFEDLFSSIVAASEAMQKSQGMIGNMLAGGVPMSPDAFANSLNMNQTILDAYLDSHFDSSQVVTDRLTQLFDELGLILGNASSALGDLYSLSEQGAAILGGLARNVADDLAVHIYTGDTRPSKFKMGDLWVKTETDEDGNTYTKRMVATSNSGNLTFNREVDPATTGFTTTYDGSLASITGANMAYDAEEGTVDIYGEHNIDIKSGGSIYIGANDHIAMVGNKTVNIGGSRINIISDDSGNVSNITSGILLQAVRAKNNSSAPITFIQTEILAKRTSSKNPKADDDFKAAVDSHLVIPSTGTNAIFKHFINPTISYTVSKSDVLGNNDVIDYDKVEALLKSNINIASSIQLSPIAIDMQAAVLQLSASSSINLLASDGSNTSVITIGTQTGIKLASSQGIFLHSGTVESAVETEITSQHFLAGASAGATGSAIEITKDYAIIAAGSTNRDTIANQGIDLSNSTITGMELRSNKFGLAVKSGTTYSGVIIDNTGILVGVGAAPTTTGSYIYLRPQKLEIGSHADLYINTNNCKLQTNYSNSSTQNIGTTIFAIGTNLNGINPATKLSEVDVSKVNFLVNQDGAYINGTIYAAAGAIGNGKYKINIGTRADNSYIYSGITSIPQSGPTTTSGFYLGTDGLIVGTSGSYLKYTASSGLTVQGAITATSGSIGSGSYKITIGEETNSRAYIHSGITNINETGSGFYLGTNGFKVGNDNSYLKYADSKLTVKGEITATKFTLGAGVQLLGGLSEQNAKYRNTVKATADRPVVELAGKTIVISGEDEGQQGLYIAPDISAYDKNNSSSRVYLNTSRARITPARIYLDLDEQTSLHMDKNGLTLQGSRVTINGKEIWGRDDIIFSEKEPRKKEYPADRDWIWIKPRANVDVYYDYVAQADAGDYKPNPISLTTDSDGGVSDSNKGYNYSIKMTIQFGVDSTYTRQTYDNVHFEGILTVQGSSAIKEFKTNIIAEVSGFSQASKRWTYTFTANVHTGSANFGANPKRHILIKNLQMYTSQSGSELNFYVLQAQVVCLNVGVAGGTTCDVIYYPAGAGPS